MTALPTKALPTGSIDIAGTSVAYRSLSRAEALQMQSFKGREDEAEVFLLVHGTGCSDEEARAFRDNNDTETAGLLIDAIIVISGLTKAATADGRGSDGRRIPDPKPSGSAT